MDWQIKRLTPELAADFFDFFDRRAFADGSPMAPCYCNAWHMSGEEGAAIQELARAGKNAAEELRQALKRLAERMVADGTLQGYLAYAGGSAVGWCNANAKANYRRFGFCPELNRFIMDSPADGVKSVVCFEIAPEYRGQGMASALLARAVLDAQAQGFAAAEGYPRLRSQRDPFDFRGPMRLYEKAGFTLAAEQNDCAIMRKVFT